MTGVQTCALPISFAALITSANPTIKGIALAAQRQIAAFFASDGTQIIQPPGVPTQFFEVGMDESELPEGLNYTLVASPLAPVGASASASDGSNDVSSGLGGGSWDRGGSINARVPDLRRDLLGLTVRATTIRRVEQREHSPVVSDEHEAVMDEALTADMRRRRSVGFDLRGVAAVDQVFADSESGQIGRAHV